MNKRLLSGLALLGIALAIGGYFHGRRPLPPGLTVASVGTDETVSAAQPASPAADRPPGAGAVPATVFGQHGPVTIQDVPDGSLRHRLLALAPEVRARALKRLGDLQVPLNDVASLNVDEDGRFFYHCPLPATPSAQVAAAAAPGSRALASLTPLGATVPVSSPPIRHSRPGASKVIYLDFNGHTITGTSWNNSLGNEGDADYRPAVATYVAKAYDSDNNLATFSDIEQVEIINIWERIAEDYKPFNVDVTTEEPASFNNSTGRILITQSVDANGVNMPRYNSAGVAYLDVFGDPQYVTRYSPALIYSDKTYLYEDYTAEAASHEMGHNLSLSHDGRTPASAENEYYGGHGAGDISWGPLMGTGYDREVTQWSKGEYYLANNTEDDLAILSGHLGYAADDHADSNGGATPLTINGTSIAGAGVIGSTGEGDRFSFTTGTGTISFTAMPYRSGWYTHGGNLDVRLELRNAADAVVASTTAVDSVTEATLTTFVSSGTYYLRVTGTSAGSPLSNPPTGYTAYGSLGAYTLTGNIAASQLPAITTHPGAVTVATGQTAQFTVAASGNPAPSYQWHRLPAAGGGWSSLANDATYSGVTTTTLTVSSPSLGMSGDQFRCVAINPEGGATSNAALLSVVNLNATQFSRLSRLYSRVLPRAGTAAELATAGTALANGSATLTGLYESLLASSEYQAREKERAIRMYYATFNRMPDHPGLVYWAGVLAGGTQTPTQVATSFAQSAEFLTTYGSLANGAFVTQMYRNTLGRDPDQAGLDYWVGQMNAGQSRGQLLLAFTDSQEFKDRMAAEVEVVRFYHLLLSRMPTGPEMATWRGFLRGEDQTATLLAAPEFTSVHPGGLSQAAFVTAAFQGFLLRGVDNVTRDGFANQLTAGSLTRAALLGQMMDSAEYRFAVVPVTRHYLSVFLRPPDVVGSTHWTNQMRAGLSLQQLAQVFAGSGEFATSYAGLNDTQFVAQMYVNILGRTADTPGLNYWVNQFATNQSDEAGLLLSFVQSAEAAQRFAAAIRTIAHFQTLYGRNPTEGEMAYWKNYLDTLTSQFRTEQLNSVEYTNSL